MSDIIYNRLHDTTIMIEVSPKKFQYKNDSTDNLVIWIIILTLICFAGIIYGSKLLNPPQEYIESDHRPGLRDFEHNRVELEKQIDQYRQNPDFNTTN